MRMCKSYCISVAVPFVVSILSVSSPAPSANIVDFPAPPIPMQSISNWRLGGGGRGPQIYKFKVVKMIASYYAPQAADLHY